MNPDFVRFCSEGSGVAPQTQHTIQTGIKTTTLITPFEQNFNNFMVFGVLNNFVQKATIVYKSSVIKIVWDRDLWDTVLCTANATHPHSKKSDLIYLHFQSKI